MRAEDLSATQAAQQVALRQKFGGSAKAAADALSSEIAALTKDLKGPERFDRRILLGVCRVADRQAGRPLGNYDD